jgi:hypothetical protein
VVLAGVSASCSVVVLVGVLHRVVQWCSRIGAVLTSCFWRRVVQWCSPAFLAVRKKVEKEEKKNIEGCDCNRRKNEREKEKGKR